MDINWTTVISSAVVATIVSGANLVATRYLGRVLDRLEAALKTPRKEK